MNFWVRNNKTGELTCLVADNRETLESMGWEILPDPVEPEYDSRFQDCLGPTYKDGELVYEVRNLDFLETKASHAKNLKQAFVKDVSWIDRERAYVASLRASELATEEKLTAYETQLKHYYTESYNERQSNKAALDAASTVSDLQAIDYTPVHSLTKAQVLEGNP